MNKLSRLLLACAACAALAAGCMDNILPGDGRLPEGVMFYTAVQDLTFFFVDGEGNDLIDYDDKTSWPQAYPMKVNEVTRSIAVERVDMTAREDGRVFYIYNDRCNAISKDFETRLWGFTTYLWGRTVEPEYTTCLYACGGLDSLRVGYTYVDAGGNENSVSSTGWGVKINSVKYNGVEVMAGNETGKVFIQKPSRDETVVKIGRL